MKTRFYFCCFLLVFSLQLHAQTDTTSVEDADDEPTLVIPPLNEKLKLGVKLGSGLSMMVGNELTNPRPTYMLTGGAYLRYRFSTHWSLQPEASISMRGSNFNNGTGQYTTIKMYTIDVPVLLLWGLNENNTANILAGLQYSRMLNSSIYLKGAQVPEDQAPRLKKNDLLGVLGAQFHTPFVGFQVAAKYGLIDINDGILPNLNPPNTGKDIHHLLLEVTLFF
jgi:hypothetical protein